VDLKERVDLVAVPDAPLLDPAYPSEPVRPLPPGRSVDVAGVVGEFGAVRLGGGEPVVAAGPGDRRERDVRDDDEMVPDLARSESGSAHSLSSARTCVQSHDALSAGRAASTAL
jgi:hypothetical protein